MVRKTLRCVNHKDININDNYWNRYIRLISEVSIPYQWQVLHDLIDGVKPSHCVQNFKIAAREAKGERLGQVFQDSDLYKWLEAVAYCLAVKPDVDLEQKADEMIDLIGRAQSSDGYINTYYTLVCPGKRWSNMTQGHELYCAGHLFEAAVAYYEATGKRKLLDKSCRFADYIADTFGSESGKNSGWPGHPEVELALVRLYRASNNRSYLNVAKHFIDIRGTEPNYFMEEIKRPDFEPIYEENVTMEPKYLQSHLPVRHQSTAEGHSVRAVYLYCAMADLAELYDDTELLAACERIWNNMTKKRMYITGGIGVSGYQECFTADYDLPNDSGYAETCASIGLAQFGIRMARITRDASYIDVVERALYNTVRSGIALSGDRYFYVNPLEVWPEICLPNTSRAHVKPVRQKWFDVACCPTNIARTLSALGQYIYGVSDDALYVNLYIENSATVKIADKETSIELICDYPKTGNIKLQVAGSIGEFTIALRLPGHAKEHSLKVNGNKTDAKHEKGYLLISRNWKNDVIELDFEIRPQLVSANPRVRANIGKLAILRGPEVYCLEEIDNGSELSSIFIAPDADICEQWDQSLLGGSIKLNLPGWRLSSIDDNNVPEFLPVSLTAVPYAGWNNRSEGEMIVWMHSLWKP